MGCVGVSFGPVRKHGPMYLNTSPLYALPFRYMQPAEEDEY